MKTRALIFSMMFAATVQAQDVVSNLLYEEVKSEDVDWEEDDISFINDIEPRDASHSTIVDYGCDEYYIQSLVWKRQTELRPQDANAWLNYFRHTRYYLRTAGFPDDYQTETLMKILDEMGKSIPDTYEYHACAYYVPSVDQETANQHAEKALEKLSAKKAKMTFFDYDTWFTYLHLRGDKARYVSFAKEYLNSGLYSQELILQNMNELNGMKANGIFIGEGDTSIIPKWLIADGMGKHQDKVMICYSFLGNPDYCQKIYSNLGIGEVPVHEGEFSDYEEYQEYMKEIIMAIAERTGRELYFSKCNGEDVNGAWEGDLYDEGLVYHYSSKEYDAMKVKRHNFENVYDLGYLLKPLDEHAWNADKMMSWRKTNEFCDLLAYYKTQDQKHYQQLYDILKNSIERVNIASEME